MPIDKKINHKKSKITNYSIGKLNTFAFVKNLKQKNEKNTSFSNRCNSSIFM